MLMMVEKAQTNIVCVFNLNTNSNSNNNNTCLYSAFITQNSFNLLELCSALRCFKDKALCKYRICMSMLLLSVYLEKKRQIINYKSDNLIKII